MYYFMKCGDTTKIIPFEIVKRYDNHILMRSLRYPSCYGLSNPYYESFFPMELQRPISRYEVIKWVENSKEYQDVLAGVQSNNPWAVQIAEEWKNIKKQLS